MQQGQYYFNLCAKICGQVACGASFVAEPHREYWGSVIRLTAHSTCSLISHVNCSSERKETSNFRTALLREGRAESPCVDTPCTSK